MQSIDNGGEQILMSSNLKAVIANCCGCGTKNSNEMKHASDIALNNS